MFLTISAKNNFWEFMLPRQAHTSCAVFIAGMVGESIIVCIFTGVPAKKNSIMMPISCFSHPYS
jgi:hypothetical protein